MLTLEEEGDVREEELRLARERLDRRETRRREEHAREVGDRERWVHKLEHELEGHEGEVARLEETNERQGCLIDEMY